MDWAMILNALSIGVAIAVGVVGVLLTLLLGAIVVIFIVAMILS